MVYAAAMILFFLHKRNPKNQGKTIGGFMYSWPEKKEKKPETPLDLDYSSYDDGETGDIQPLMADSGSIVSSKQRTSSFFENISKDPTQD